MCRPASTYILLRCPQSSGFLSFHLPKLSSFLPTYIHQLKLSDFDFLNINLLSLSSCLNTAIHIRLLRRRGTSLPTAPAVPSAVLQIRMRTGPRSPTLLSGDESRTALLNATIVRSSIVITGAHY